jgi:hypothetical protein
MSFGIGDVTPSEKVKQISKTQTEQAVKDCDNVIDQFNGLKEKEPKFSNINSERDLENYI